MKSEYIIRIAKIFIGTFINAFGVILLIHANIGLEPWSVLHQGLAIVFNTTYGTTSIVIGFVVLVLGIILKEPFGYGTIGNILFFGIVVDFFENTNLIPYMNSTFSGCVMMIIGMFILCYGTYVYMSSRTGSGPRDMLMVGLSKTFKKSPGFCRIVTEVIVLIIGYFLGGPVGIGTIICTLGMGIVINIVFHLTNFHPQNITMESAAETTRNIKRAFFTKH